MSDFDFPYIWIERKYCSECLEYSARATGIRITYAQTIDPLLREQMDLLIRYLRKIYYFPIRVNITVTDHRRYHSEKDGHIYYGIFYDNENLYAKKKVYPQIAVAG
ncbi:MAG: hypothetical protein IJ489_06440 [Clostridia bacterium]|nr:hypothetical protein [Clostridia bacterium]